MNIHLRACPRCGGDVDAAAQDDVRCIQCGHRIYETAAGLRDGGRPEAVRRSGSLNPFVVSLSNHERPFDRLRANDHTRVPCMPLAMECRTLSHFDTHTYMEPDLDLPGQRPDLDAAASPCPRCRSVDLVPLDRLDPGHNLCLRCRLCGHIFSPSAA